MHYVLSYVYLVRNITFAIGKRKKKIIITKLSYLNGTIIFGVNFSEF